MVPGAAWGMYKSPFVGYKNLFLTFGKVKGGSSIVKFFLTFWKVESGKCKSNSRAAAATTGKAVPTCWGKGGVFKSDTKSSSKSSTQPAAKATESSSRNNRKSSTHILEGHKRQGWVFQRWEAQKQPQKRSKSSGKET